MLVLIGCVIITPALSFAASYFQDNYISIQQELHREQLVAEEFKKILAWKEAEILSFLEKHDIKKPSSLRLPDIIPLIARFHAKSEEARSSAEKANKLLLSSGIEDREIRLGQRNLGWNDLEKKTIPAALEAAFALQILKNPTFVGSFSDHFQMIQKSFDERQFDRLIDKNDDYLMNPSRMTFDSLRNTLDPKQLNTLIYG